MTYEEFIKLLNKEKEKQIKLILKKKKGKFNENIALIAFLNYDEMLFIVGEYYDESVIDGSGSRLIEDYHSGTTFRELSNALKYFEEV